MNLAIASLPYAPHARRGNPPARHTVAALEAWLEAVAIEHEASVPAHEPWQASPIIDMSLNSNTMLGNFDGYLASGVHIIDMTPNMQTVTANSSIEPASAQWVRESGLAEAAVRRRRYRVWDAERRRLSQLPSQAPPPVFSLHSIGEASSDSEPAA